MTADRPSPIPRFLADDPDHWRRRAEQIRLLAEGVQDRVSKAILRRIAAEYEKLAERVEGRKGASSAPRQIVPPGESPLEARSGAPRHR